jgi:hypothetical protein
MTDAELISELNKLRTLMIDVATGRERIDDVNSKYQEIKASVGKALSSRQIEDTNPYQDLWQWYKKWKADFPTYQQRRDFVAELLDPLLTEIQQPRTSRNTILEDSPTGWNRVDRGVDKCRHQLSFAQEEEDFQQVGLLCREILISLAQAVYDPTLHESLDGTEPSPTDAKRMLESFIEHELEGKSNYAARRHAKASLDLANELQHRRTAAFRLAALCAEATTSVVNTVTIISGRRDQIHPNQQAQDKEAKSRERVIEWMSGLSDLHRSMLQTSFSCAEDSNGSLIFGWTTVGGGLCTMESELYLLLDENAVLPMREEVLSPRETRRWYKFKPWLFEYLKANPEVRGK